MSTSETDILTIGSCPCGAGTIKEYTVTQDNPFSKWIKYFEIKCNICASEWRIEHDHYLVLKSSEIEYNSARKSEESAYNQLHNFVESLVDDYFCIFAVRSKKAEWAEMCRLGITSLSYANYLKSSKGKTPGQASYGLGNLAWLTKLAEKQSLDEKLCNLLSVHNKAKQATEYAAKKIVRKNFR
jgi:hypothetical protein